MGMDNTGWDKKEKKTFKQHKGEQEEQKKNKPSQQHSSQGHKTDAKGTVTSTREKTLRSATTDSSRIPKKETDDRPTGGNNR